MEGLPIENLTDPAIAELTSDLVDWKIITDPQKINLKQDQMGRLKKTGNLFISKACILIPYLLFEEFRGEIDFQSKKSFNEKMNSIVEGLEEKKEQTKFHLNNLEDETSNEVDSFKNQIVNLHEELKNNAENFIKETNKKAETLSLVLTEAVTDNEKLRKNLDEFKQYAESQKEEVNRAVQATRDAAAKTVAVKFSKDFKRQSKENSQTAIIWLTFTIGFFIGSLAYMFWLYNEELQTKIETAQVIRDFGLRFITLSLFLGAMAWCANQFKILKNLETLNNHRALSLESLEAFLAGVEDPQAKDAVVMETARAIFQNANTGYLDGNQTPIITPTQVMEISKTFKKT